MRLIDADALLGKIENYYQYNACLNREIAMWVNDEPTVKPKPEIIMCKDCEWWEKQKDSLQGRCALMQMYPTGEWFCGNAQERRTDDLQ